MTYDDKFMFTSFSSMLFSTIFLWLDGPRSALLKIYKTRNNIILSACETFCSFVVDYKYWFKFMPACKLMPAWKAIAKLVLRPLFSKLGRRFHYTISLRHMGLDKSSSTA